MEKTTIYKNMDNMRESLIDFSVKLIILFKKDEESGENTLINKCNITLY